MRHKIRKIKQDLRNKTGRNRRRVARAWIEMPLIRTTRRRERTPARENSECETRIQIESHRGQSEMGGVGLRHVSGLGDEGWRRACNSKKGKKVGWRKWGQNTARHVRVQSQKLQFRPPLSEGSEPVRNGPGWAHSASQKQYFLKVRKTVTCTYFLHPVFFPFLHSTPSPLLLPVSPLFLHVSPSFLHRFSMFLHRFSIVSPCFSIVSPRFSIVSPCFSLVSLPMSLISIMIAIALNHTCLIWKVLSPAITPPRA